MLSKCPGIFSLPDKTQYFNQEPTGYKAEATQYSASALKSCSSVEECYWDHSSWFPDLKSTDFLSD